jgi:hypothetical protein
MSPSLQDWEPTADNVMANGRSKVSLLPFSRAWPRGSCVFFLLGIGASEGEVDHRRKNCCGLCQYDPFKIVTLQHTGEVEDQNSNGDRLIDEEHHLREDYDYQPACNP